MLEQFASFRRILPQKSQKTLCFGPFLPLFHNFFHNARAGILQEVSAEDFGGERDTHSDSPLPLTARAKSNVTQSHMEGTPE